MELQIGDLVIHNKKKFIVKFSTNLKVLVLRIENDPGMNWRDLSWFNNVKKYCKVIRNGEIIS